MKFNLLILGSGTYGTAVAISLSHSKKVLLWSHNSKHVNDMQVDRCNKRFLPNFYFPRNLHLESSLYHALSSTKNVFIAIPSYAVSEILIQMKPYLNKNHRLILASKGLEKKTGRLFSEVVHKNLDKIPLAIFSGPTFAKDIALGLPVFADVATEHENFGIKIRKLFQKTNINIFLSHNILSPQISGIVKNIVAIITGISDSMSYGSSVRSYLIFLGLQETCKIGKVMKVSSKSFISISGICDLVMSCTDNKSRNRRFGKFIGKSLNVNTALKRINSLTEGYLNIRELFYFSQQNNIDTPLITTVYNILYKNVSPKKALKYLLSKHNFI